MIKRERSLPSRVLYFFENDKSQIERTGSLREFVIRDW